MPRGAFLGADTERQKRKHSGYSNIFCIDEVSNMGLSVELYIQLNMIGE